MRLAPYDPPSAQRACVAVGLSPIIVLLAFTLIVTQLIDTDTGFATFLACTVWVAYELHDYQRLVDAYNEDYVATHLVWRSNETLTSLIAAEGTHEATREFVRAFLAAGRVLMRAGPSH